MQSSRSADGTTKPKQENIVQRETSITLRSHIQNILDYLDCIEAQHRRNDFVEKKDSRSNSLQNIDHRENDALNDGKAMAIEDLDDGDSSDQSERTKSQRQHHPNPRHNRSNAAKLLDDDFFAQNKVIILENVNKCNGNHRYVLERQPDYEPALDDRNSASDGYLTPKKNRQKKHAHPSYYMQLHKNSSSEGSPLPEAKHSTPRSTNTRSFRSAAVKESQAYQQSLSFSTQNEMSVNLSSSEDESSAYSSRALHGLEKHFRRKSDKEYALMLDRLKQQELKATQNIFERTPKNALLQKQLMTNRALQHRASVLHRDLLAVMTRTSSNASIFIHVLNHVQASLQIQANMMENLLNLKSSALSVCDRLGAVHWKLLKDLNATYDCVLHHISRFSLHKQSRHLHGDETLRCIFNELRPLERNAMAALSRSV